MGKSILTDVVCYMKHGASQSEYFFAFFREELKFIEYVPETFAR